MNPASYALLAGACIVLATGVAYGIVEAIARALFDTVHEPEHDETAPAKDLP